jgi:uncharacterized protein YhaN
VLIDDHRMGPESLKSQLTDLDREIDSIDDQIRDLQTSLGEMSLEIRQLKQKSDLPSILYRIAQSEAAAQVAAMEAVAMRLAASIVEDVKTEVEQRNQPNIVRAASHIVDEVTSGEWSGLFIDEENKVLKVLYRNGTSRASTALSAGAKDVVRLAIRIAVADEHAQRHGVALPLLCDDPSGDVDSERTPRVIEILKRSAQTRQVFLFTHDERTVELALTAGAKSVDLTALG